MKVLSHPSHGSSKCCIVDNWACFSFLKKLHLSFKKLPQFTPKLRRVGVSLQSCQQMLTGPALLRHSSAMLCCVSAPSHLWQSGRYQSRYTGFLFLLDATAWRSNSAEFSTEQTGSHTLKKQHNIQLIFIIKHWMPAQNSEKRKIQSLPLIVRMGTLCVVVFIIHTNNCGHAWLC